MKKSEISEFDYIVVGAGSAGCIVASRLSEDPSISVLIVEAGGTDKKLTIMMPGALPMVYQNKSINWGYESGPEPHLNGKVIDEKAGKIVGGSTSINAMIYNRGNPMDYDGWADDGLTDWDFAHCLPYFRKMETFVDGEDEWRGGSGPMFIGRCEAEHKLFDTFIHGGQEAGFELTPDHNGFKQEGLHIAQTFIHEGIRWSSSRGYLYPALGRPNLKLLKNALVTRIVVEGDSAVGIQIYRGHGKELIRARCETIISAGAIGTPRLLLLSGIGPADELRSVGIDSVVDIAKVGKNLQNHPGVDVQYQTAFKDSLTSQVRMIDRPMIGAEWLFLRRGLGAANFFEAGAFLRTRDDVKFPNMQYEFLPLTRQLKNGKLVPVPGFQLWMDLSRPLSRGAVTLKSANPQDKPSVIHNHLEDPQDLKDLVDGVRLARELLNQPAWEKFRGLELNPGADVQTDSELEAFIRERCNTSYHISGTCSMGVSSDDVVDSEGRVNAIANLRIVDASIMPKVITGNLNAPVMMMAEKISDRILGRAPLAPSSAAYYSKP